MLTLFVDEPNIGLNLQSPAGGIGAFVDSFYRLEETSTVLLPAERELGSKVIGMHVYSINGETTTHLSAVEICRRLENMERPITITFEDRTNYYASLDSVSLLRKPEVWPWLLDYCHRRRRIDKSERSLVRRRLLCLIDCYRLQTSHILDKAHKEPPLNGIMTSATYDRHFANYLLDVHGKDIIPDASSLICSNGPLSSASVPHLGTTDTTPYTGESGCQLMVLLALNVHFCLNSNQKRRLK
jgi:hypothetical protein